MSAAGSSRTAAGRSRRRQRKKDQTRGGCIESCQDMLVYGQAQEAGESRCAKTASNREPCRQPPLPIEAWPQLTCVAVGARCRLPHPLLRALVALCGHGHTVSHKEGGVESHTKLRAGRQERGGRQTRTGEGRQPGGGTEGHTKLQVTEQKCQWPMLQKAASRCTWRGQASKQAGRRAGAG